MGDMIGYSIFIEVVVVGAFVALAAYLLRIPATDHMDYLLGIKKSKAYEWSHVALLFLFALVIYCTEELLLLFT